MRNWRSSVRYVNDDGLLKIEWVDLGAGYIGSTYADPSFMQSQLSWSATLALVIMVKSFYPYFVANPFGFPANHYLIS